MDKNSKKKFFMYLVVFPLALVGLFAVIQTTGVGETALKYLEKMRRKESSSGLRKIYKDKGLTTSNNLKVERKKIVPKNPGEWIVATEDGPTVDSTNLEDVFYSASPLDVIKIQPGQYDVLNLDIRVPILLEGQGTDPSQTILSIKSKSLITIPKTNLKKVEWRNLTLKNKNKTFSGGFLSFRSSHGIFRKCEILLGNTEHGLEGLKGSTIDLDQSLLVTSHRGTGITLRDSAKLLLSRSTLKGNKLGVYGDIESFDGRARIDQTLFSGNRSAGIMIYGGTSKITKSIFKKNMVGAQLRRSGQHEITDSRFENNEQVGIEIQGVGQAKLNKNKIHLNGKEGILVYDGAKQVQINDNEIMEHEIGIHIYKDSSAKVLDSNIGRSERAGIKISADSNLEAKNLDFAQSNKSLLVERSMVQLEKISFNNAVYGIFLKDKSQLRAKDLSYNDVQERIRNEYESSLVDINN